MFHYVCFVKHPSKYHRHSLDSPTNTLTQTHTHIHTYTEIHTYSHSVLNKKNHFESSFKHLFRPIASHWAHILWLIDFEQIKIQMKRNESNEICRLAKPLGKSEKYCGNSPKKLKINWNWSCSCYLSNGFGREEEMEELWSWNWRCPSISALRLFHAEWTSHCCFVCHQSERRNDDWWESLQRQIIVSLQADWRHSVAGIGALNDGSWHVYRGHHRITHSGY